MEKIVLITTTTGAKILAKSEIEILKEQLLNFDILNDACLIEAVATPQGMASALVYIGDTYIRMNNILTYTTLDKKSPMYSTYLQTTSGLEVPNHSGPTLIK